MQLHLDLFDIEIAIDERGVDESGSDPERAGWFWQESRRPARGPFPSAETAILDVADWVGRVTAPPSEPLSQGLVLARQRLATAKEFLSHLDDGFTPNERVLPPEPVLHSFCVGVELTLKAYLLSRGLSDEACRDRIGHDLGLAWRLASTFGLPNADDQRIATFISAVSDPYKRHELGRLSDSDVALLLARPRPSVLRLLRRAVELRVEDDMAHGLSALLELATLSAP